MSVLARRLAAGCLLAAGVSAAWAQVPADPFNYCRTSSFTYVSSGVQAGLLQTETVESTSTPDLCVVTTHAYDAFGNKSSAVVNNCGSYSPRAAFPSRQASTTFAAVATQPITVAGAARNVSIPAGLFATSTKAAVTGNINDPQSHTESRSYDPRFGAVLSATAPDGVSTTYLVDDFGRKTREVRADGTSTVVSYCILTGKGLDTASNSPGCGTTGSLSGLSAATEIPSDAISYVQTVQLDTAGAQMSAASRVYMDRAARKLRELVEGFNGGSQPTDRRYVVRDWQYNAQGTLILTTQPYFLGANSSTLTGSGDYGMTLTTYDALGRAVQVDVADPQGNVDNVDFAGRGNRKSARTVIQYEGLKTNTTRPQNQQKTEEKNVDGKVVRVTDAYGAQTAYQHDAFGNLVATKDALQNIVTTAYDIRGRKRGMTDPDSGYWEYDYNAIGELVWQRSPNQRAAGSETTMAYDRLGRMITRTEPDYVSSWFYDAYASGACNAGKGKLCESSTNTGIVKKTVYDNLGRVSSASTSHSGGPTLATAVTYHTVTGRVDTQSYPTGLVVRHGYTATRGFLDRLTNVTPGTGVNLPANTVLWSATTVNAWGKGELQSAGNVNSRATYDSLTGRATALSAGIGSGSSVLSHFYAWDNLGNLTSRNDLNGDGTSGPVNETFQHDSLNRLTQYTVQAAQIAGGARAVQLHYNAVGNVIFKSDVGNYDYAPFGNVGGVSNPRPHAVKTVAGPGMGTVNYLYDANGNMTSASGGQYSTVAYTSFNLPDSTSGAAGPNGTPRYTWAYDENHQRVRERRVDANGTRTTWFHHPDNRGGLAFESETAPSGAVSNRHYLSAGTQTLVLVSTGALQAGGQTTPPAISSIALTRAEYWHRDHLGSLVATTDLAGNVTARYAYDPFGKRRFTNGRYDDFGTLVVDWSNGSSAGADRGFTGHEHIDDIGVIHMNGRLYDPLTGRFMQADPFIQDPSDLQSFNRYSYCFNGPMACTDPTGYFNLRKFVRTVVAIVVAYYGAGWLEASGIAAPGTFATLTSTGYSATLPGAATAGFFSGAIAGGSFKSGVYGAFNAFLFYGVGEAVGDAGLAGKTAYDVDRFAAAVILHGVAGCVGSAAAGGRCGPEALSGALSKAALPWTASYQEGIERAMVHAVVGGTASALGGGKFANGAMTAAFSYLFNHLLSKGGVRDLFGMSKGHHSFAKQWAWEYRELISEDALAVLGGSTIGPNVIWEGDHPNRYPGDPQSGHRAYNEVGGRKIVDDFFAEKGITPTNQLNVKQSYELLDRLNRHDFNVKMQEYVDHQQSRGRVNTRVIRPRGGTAQPGD